MKQTMDGISGLADKECSLYFSIWVTPKILVLHSTVVPVIFSVSVFTRYQIQPVSVFFGRYCCTVSFGGNTFLRFRGNSFFEKFSGNSFFLQKEGECSKRGPRPPLLRKKGAPTDFYQVFLWYRYGKF